MNDLVVALTVFWLVGTIFTFIYASLTRFKKDTFGYHFNEDFTLALMTSMLWFLAWPWYACIFINPRLNRWWKEGKWK